ncbi:cobalt transport family protein [Mycobacterium kansasii 732]|uniref:Energy-coupling factor transporter transmembrane protein EcfT n=1 Tax=Mycobacterium pseudokansasii TaxID=2341080 RepID=A0A498QW75_9MYCO|nr:energy-coupling factor transporter transmembrane protein EcfT [Mycobacterium pseudokansasii]EUA10601.1 cobalt transport family protein [Mycobacterium kansasii 732]MBY0390814.1 energy-coupling factor transporter transmembrane protein EcfT [Mycobacterium pseudokansasii]VBA52741.1 Energy-coupling factor transporter transmembrane protein EcfT [Mycobacterium pseudokansasii]
MTLSATAASDADGRGARRPTRPVVLLVPVPGTSVIHDLWAGTKLLVVFGISVLLTFYPGWVTIGLMAALVLTAARLAHIPRGAVPSVPRWLWVVLAIGGITAALAGGAPSIAVAGVELELGGALNFLRITALSIVLLALGAMVSWTTNVAEIGPALASLGRPLRLLRIPVDEWAVTLALALRAFPMLIDEFQVLYAARRLRPKRIPRSRKARRQRRTTEVIDLLAAAITVTLRRADEMGDAITARGGTGQLSAYPARPKLTDWTALMITAVTGGAAVAIETLLRVT